MPDGADIARVSVARAVFEEALKTVPGLGLLIEGVRAYQEQIEEEQKQAFVAALSDRVQALEHGLSENLISFLSSDEGHDFRKKLVAAALDARNADKIDFYVSAFVNAQIPSDQLERFKFLDLIGTLSRPALLLLAFARDEVRKSEPHGSRQIVTANLVVASKISPHLVQACVNELYASGALSSVIRFSNDGRPMNYFSEGTPAFTEFSDRLARFLNA